MYAPITRDGLPLDKKASKYEVQPDALLSYNGVTELSNSMPAKFFKVQPAMFKFSTKLGRNEVHHTAELMKAQALIDAKKKAYQESGALEQSGEAAPGEEVKEKQDMLSMKDILIRPDTPECEEVGDRRPPKDLKVEME